MFLISLVLANVVAHALTVRECQTSEIQRSGFVSAAVKKQNLELCLATKKDAEKVEIKNCYEQLNKKVKGLQKTLKIYDVISADLRFPKKLKRASAENPSFKIFIEKELQVKIPLNTEGSVS